MKFYGEKLAGENLTFTSTRDDTKGRIYFGDAQQSWYDEATNTWSFNGNNLVADWSRSTPRYFAVDYDGGNDGAVGFSDVSLAVAGTKAIKTLEKLLQILPRFGNGRSAVVAIKARASGATYRNQADTADDDLLLVGVSGYDLLLIRATATVSTASSTAFANDAADLIACGGMIASGTESAGYRVAGSPTVLVIDCVKASNGAAPALSAEPALIGKRVRFAFDTPTVALRNLTSAISSNDTDTITLSQNLPSAPAAGGAGVGDVFYIEEPSVRVNRIWVDSADVGVTQGLLQHSGLTIVGIKAVDTADHAGGNADSVRIMGSGSTGCYFVETAGRFNTRYSDRIISGASYSDESFTSRRVGLGIRAERSLSIRSNIVQIVAGGAFDVGSVSSSVEASNGATIGSGCVFWSGLVVDGAGKGAPPVSTQASANAGFLLVGSMGLADTTRLRVAGATNAAGLLVRYGSPYIDGLSVSGCGSLPAIKLEGVGQNVAINDVIGSAGNSDVGIDLAGARDASLVLGGRAANTVTGSLGDVRLNDVTGTAYIKTHTDIDSMDEIDGQGNHLQGTGRAPFASRRPFLHRVVTITYAASVTPDLRKGNIFDLAMTGNVTIANPTGLTAYHDGMTLKFRLVPNGNTVAWGTQYEGGDDVTFPPDISTASGKGVELLFSYYHAAAKLRLLSPPARGYTG